MRRGWTDRLPLKRLRVGVPEDLRTLSPAGGHGKVWHRVLTQLEQSARIVSVPGDGAAPRRPGRAPQVVLASGHARVPPPGVPLVVQVHEAGWFDPRLREALNPEFLADIEWHTERAVRAATRVITPSSAARRDVIVAYGLDPHRVHSVPHGVDPIFRPSAQGGRALVAAARAGRPAPYVLFAAAFHPRKNLGALRDAIAMLAGEGFPHVLVIAGAPAREGADPEADERAASAELPGAPDRVVRIPSPSDAELAGLMAEAEAFCLPSLYEGFGLTALEAMGSGAPVVVSDRGALPEVVGDAGVVVSPNAEAVAGGLRRVLGDPAAATDLGRAAALRAKRFTWESTAAGWLRVLRRAADQSGAT